MICEFLYQRVRAVSLFVLMICSYHMQRESNLYPARERHDETQEKLAIVRMIITATAKKRRRKITQSFHSLHPKPPHQLIIFDDRIRKLIAQVAVAAALHVTSSRSELDFPVFCQSAPFLTSLLPRCGHCLRTRGPAAIEGQPLCHHHYFMAFISYKSTGPLWRARWVLLAQENSLQSC